MPDAIAQVGDNAREHHDEDYDAGSAQNVDEVHGYTSAAR
jgi:hypothetical protein